MNSPSGEIVRGSFPGERTRKKEKDKDDARRPVWLEATDSFLQEAEPDCKGMRTIALRSAQQGPRCLAPGNTDTNFRLEQKY